MPEYDALMTYIKELVRARGLSLRQASIRSGLAPETVSKAIRRSRDGPPRPATLRKLAAGLDGDYAYMMRLAGHMGPTAREIRDQELYAMLMRIQELLRQIGELDPERAREVGNAAATLVEMHLAAFPDERLEEVREEQDG